MVGLAFAITAMSQGCRTATQVELVVTYNGACTDLDEVAFIIGTDAKIAEGRIETNLFTTTTKQCTPGGPNRVGTLVVTPNDATGHASIIVLASSFGQPITACKPEMGYQGCIVARRAFAFVDHTALTLEIPLEVDCKNVPCDAESTCKHAACVASTVSCDERGCSEPGALPDGGTELVDAPTDPDGFVQRLDAESMADVGADAPGITDASLEADAPPTMDAGIDSGANGGTCGVPF